MDKPDQSQPLSVFVLEDEAFMARHITQSLESGLDHVCIQTSDNAPEALEMILEQRFDCLILDRMVQQGDGLEVLRALRMRDVETPAIIISNLNEIDNRTEGLENGADDYLGKAFEPAELVARVRAAIRRGQTQGHPKILKLDRLELHRKAQRAWWGEVKIKLRPKDFMLLLTLSEHYPAAASLETLWENVWPDMGGLSPQKAVVHTTISRLRRSLLEQHVPVEIASGDDGYSLHLPL